jgi:hypothetical protein
MLAARAFPPFLAIFFRCDSLSAEARAFPPFLLRSVAVIQRYGTRLSKIRQARIDNAYVLAYDRFVLNSITTALVLVAIGIFAACLVNAIRRIL